jgi:predicted nucleic acid-binding Zn ribbon protein
MAVYRFNKENASRRPGIKTLGEAIESLLDSYKLRAKFDETSVTAFWEKIIGKHIASHTSAVYVKNKVLFLKIDSAPLRNELVLAKSKLIQSVNREYGYEMIDDIVFI